MLFSPRNLRACPAFCHPPFKAHKRASGARQAPRAAAQSQRLCWPALKQVQQSSLTPGSKVGGPDARATTPELHAQRDTALPARASRSTTSSQRAQLPQPRRRGARHLSHHTHTLPVAARNFLQNSVTAAPCARRPSRLAKGPCLLPALRLVLYLVADQVARRDVADSQ